MLPCSRDGKMEIAVVIGAHDLVARTQAEGCRMHFTEAL
jgi:hypothetical protein